MDKHLFTQWGRGNHLYTKGGGQTFYSGGIGGNNDAADVEEEAAGGGWSALKYLPKTTMSL